MDQFDTIIIGSGPGGYVAAIRTAQLGASVAIIEKRATLGGTCLNVGCIPSKALLDSSEKYEMTRSHLGDHGIEVSSVKLNLSRLMARKDKVVSEVCNGVDFLMKKNKIRRYHAFGRLAGEGRVDLLDPADAKKKTDTISGRNIILASGSVPIDIPGVTVDGKTIITSDHAIALEKVPEHLLIIGAGVIGLELGSVWRRLGAKVTVVELMPRLFPSADKQVCSYYERILRGQGMEFLFEHKVEKAESAAGKVKLHVKAPDGKAMELAGDCLLVAVGRRPYTEGLGLETAGVKLTDRKRIAVDPQTYATSAPGIYAIGDAIDGPMLAHKAEDEGIALAEMLAGNHGHVNYGAIPGIIYTWPEMAWVGYGEEELKEKGISFRTGKSFFKANARAKAMNESDGMIKILADAATDRILGVYAVGPNASELISEAVIAMEFGSSAEDIARSVHGHPTLSEIMRDAAQSVGGWAIHA